jgi:hypothetical protein
MCTREYVWLILDDKQLSDILLPLLHDPSFFRMVSDKLTVLMLHLFLASEYFLVYTISVE